MSCGSKIIWEWMDKDGNYHDLSESPIDELIKERDKLQEKIGKAIEQLKRMSIGGCDTDATIALDIINILEE